jgi:hypothetical protein
MFIKTRVAHMSLWNARSRVRIAQTVLTAAVKSIV